MVEAHLVVIGDLHNVHSCVNIKIRHQQFPGVSWLQGTQWTLAVVPQPGERVQTLASILPLYLDHPLLIQCPDVAHWVVSQRERGRPQCLLPTQLNWSQTRGQWTRTSPWSRTSPQSLAGRGRGAPLQGRQGETCKCIHPHVRQLCLQIRKGHQLCS